MREQNRKRSAQGRLRVWHWLLITLTMSMAIASVVLIVRIYCRGALDAPSPAERRALVMARIRPHNGANCATYSYGAHHCISCQLTHSTDLDPGDAVRPSTAIGKSDIAVAAYDTMGRYRWHHTLGSPAADTMLSTIQHTDDLFVHCAFGAAPLLASADGRAPLAVPAGHSIACFALDGHLCWVRTVTDLKADSTVRWPFPVNH